MKWEGSFPERGFEMARKVLLALFDGMRPDSLASSPIAAERLRSACFTLSAHTVMPSVTLPCHMSLFHSVDPTRHNNVTNTYTPQVRPVKGLCEVLAEAGKKCAFFYDWEELRDLARPGSVAISQFVSGHALTYPVTTRRSTEALIRCIAEDAPDFVFFYLGYTDDAGHRCGWMSDEYLEAVRVSWESLDKVVRTLPADYDVFVTADHGGHDRSHGFDVPEDMTIPVVCWGDGIVSPDMNDVSIKDLAPTIARLLGVAPDGDWEGKALL